MSICGTGLSPPVRVTHHVDASDLPDAQSVADFEALLPSLRRLDGAAVAEQKIQPKREARIEIRGAHKLREIERLKFSRRKHKSIIGLYRQ